MYSFLNASTVVSAVRPPSAYEWFIYKSKKPVQLEFRGHPVVIGPGTRFGVRKSADKKKIRLILKDEPTKVLTLTLKQAQDLAKGIDPKKRG